MARALVLDRKEYSPAGGSLRGSSTFNFFSLLAALYLIVALCVPGTFLIAKQAPVVHSSYLIVPEERSSYDQLAGDQGEEEGEHPWYGPKRLRGALLQPKVGINKIVNLLGAPVAGPATLLEHAEPNKQVVADEVQLSQDDAFPQELLGRSPPSSR